MALDLRKWATKFERNMLQLLPLLLPGYSAFGQLHCHLTFSGGFNNILLIFNGLPCDTAHNAPQHGVSLC